MVVFQSFLIASGFFLYLSGYASSQIFTTSGESGEVCGPEGLKCLKGRAECESDTNCVCKRRRYPLGKGRLNCYRTSEYYTEIDSDPTFTTFNNNSVDFTLPCRFLVTHFTTGLEDKKKQNIGQCVFKIHGFQEKDKGKMYMAGYDVAVSIEYNNQQPFKASFRKTGEAKNGTYTYVVNATNGQYLPDGPWGSDAVKYVDNINKINVECKKSGYENTIYLNIRRCGVRIKFRAYDSILRRNQTMVPGLSIAVNRDFPPVEFLSESKVMAMVPSEKNNGFELDSVLVGLLNRRQSMVYRALTSGVTQNQPEANDNCRKAMYFLNHCSTDQKMKDAFDNCLWILKSPRFIRCFDSTKSGEPIMGLFNNCTAIYCGSATCQSVVDEITTAGCHTVEGYDHLTQFLGGHLCPSPP